MKDPDGGPLIGQFPGMNPRSHNGSPLVMLVLVLVSWIGGRSVLWENPFSPDQVMAQASQLLAAAPKAAPSVRVNDAQAFANSPGIQDARYSALASGNRVFDGDKGPGPTFGKDEAGFAVAHHALWRVALSSDLRSVSWRSRRTLYENAEERQARVPFVPGTPSFARRNAARAGQVPIDRWSLGAWVFVRQGSNATPITAGPAPIYGASQLGASLQYRLVPASPHNPIAYGRAVRALIDRPESEIAVGVSALPIGSLPVRVAAEVRATDNAIGQDLRPAAFAVTQLPPMALPLNLAAEVYAAAGYVGGDADTAFVDGQTTLTRDIGGFDLTRADDIRLSIGAGAWGGAQRGAQRLDIGPTVRIDMALGEVPARFSIDYRERVGGEAMPASGIAATLSTQF